MASEVDSAEMYREGSWHCIESIRLTAASCEAQSHPNAIAKVPPPPPPGLCAPHARVRGRSLSDS